MLTLPVEFIPLFFFISIKISQLRRTTLPSPQPSPHAGLRTSLIKGSLVSLVGMYPHLFVLLPSGTSGKESACPCKKHKRCGFDPWVRNIPWSRKWQPTPVSLLGKCHGQRSLEATVHGVAKSRTQLSIHAHMHLMCLWQAMPFLSNLDHK